MATTTRTVVREHEAELLVQKAEVVAEDVVALTLVSPAGETLPSWSPGAHIDLVLADDLVRQYSLCSAPGEDGAWRIGVLRTPDSRGGSQRVHDTLTEGATVTIRGPRNHFPLVAASTYLFIAGGIGITPMLPMIAQAEAAGADWRLLYGGRHRASMAFLPELAQYGDLVTVVPQDEAGFLDLDGVLGTPQEGTLVYCCGPEGLLSAVEAKCANWPSGSLHLERFSAKPQETSEVADESFELVLQQTGVTVTVPPNIERLRGGTRGRCQRPRLLHGGHLRHLRDRGRRGRRRPPRLRPQRGRAGLQRVHDDLRVPLQVEAARPGHLDPPNHRTARTTAHCTRGPR